jgi:ParB family chromosome partitioning protein
MAKPKPTAATADTGALRMVPLSQLYLHPFNTRAEPPAAEINELAQSIQSAGLMQNLSGYDDPTNPGLLGIVAGGRRWRALVQIHGAADPLIPVRVTTDPVTAKTWAGTENEARKPLHPADQIRAYADMAAYGADPAQISKYFAVTQRHVQGRLKLAELPDAVLTALRTNKITLDHAAAFTLARDADQAVTVLQSILTNGYNNTAADVRRQLTRDSIPATDRRAVFVGLQNYTCYGGRVQSDLFTDAVQLLDADILDTAFTERLANRADMERLNGWKWIEALTTSWADYNLSGHMHKINPVPVDLPDADQAELEQLHEQGEARELSETELARLDLLEQRAAGDYTDADRATSGGWLFVDREGKLQFHGPYRRREDIQNADAGGDAGDGIAQKSLPAKAPPQNLLDDLAKIKLLSLQTALLAQPLIMVDLLAYQLTTALSPYDLPLAFTTQAPNLTPEKAEGTTISPRLADKDHNFNAPKPSAESYAAFLSQPAADRMNALGLAITRLLRDTKSDLSTAIAQQLNTNARNVWTPTAAAYFRRLPGAALDAIYMDLTPSEKADHAAFKSQKSAAKAATLEALFTDLSVREALGLSRAEAQRIDAWLPTELQWPQIEDADDDTAKAA